MQLPRAPLYPLAYGAEVDARFTGKEPFLTSDALKMSKHHMFFSSGKARRELGFDARPFVRGIEDALNWFRQAGYIQ